ncbi:hypothetical protein [Bradyrhizobium pachyrhizi]|uniref:hypothetical protein n=1 Tax=Bradyrhizobium pachyrhizi TaxID=280333 RepID=UPI0012E385DE|nr:hypothetical protein [Bradyrhizobium pachyrhizi]
MSLLKQRYPKVAQHFAGFAEPPQNFGHTHPFSAALQILPAAATNSIVTARFG